MAGFPTRSNRSAFGPSDLEDERPVIDPKREIGASTYKLNFWQLAGLCQSSPLALLRCSVSGGVVTTDVQGLAWDADGALSAITWTYAAAGVYQFAFASTYNNELGAAIALVLRGGMVAATNAMPATGTHDGLDNVAVLTDTSQSWTVNEFAGMEIYNLTDGSQATIVSNTADTVTGALGGGTDNDWDIDDEYIILDAKLEGILQLTSDYAGTVVFRDAAGDPAEVSEFLLAIW